MRSTDFETLHRLTKDMGLSDEEKAYAEKLYKDLDLPRVKCTGGWRRDYKTICEKLGYEVGTPSNYFGVYKHGERIGRVDTVKCQDLVQTLLLLQKQHDANKKIERQKSVENVGCFAAMREMQSTLDRPVRMPMVPRRGMAMAFALGALACGYAGPIVPYDNPSPRLKR